MATVEDLLVRISANTALLERELKKAEGATAQSTRRMQQTLDGFDRRVERLGGTLRTAFATFGLGLGVAQVTSFATRAFEAAAGLGELAEQLGVSTDALQVYQFAAVQSGVKTEELEAGLMRLTRSIGEAVQGDDKAIRAFRAMGVSILDANGAALSAEAVFRQIADGYANAGNKAEFLAQAADVGGRSFQRLAPLLSGGAAQLDGWAESARAAGVVIEKDMIDRLDRASDAMARVGFWLERHTALLGGGLIELVQRLGESWDETRRRMEAAGPATQIRVLRQEIEQLDQLIARLAARGGFTGAGDAALEEAGRQRAERQLALDRLTAPPGAAAAGSSGAPRLPVSEKEKAAAEKAMKQIEEDAARLGSAIEEALDKAEAKAMTRQLEDAERAAERFKTAAKKIAEETRTPMEEYNARLAELNMHLAAGTINQETHARAAKLAADEMEKAERATTGLADASRDLGHAIGTAFEDAIVKGGTLRDVLQGLLQDIQRIALRAMVTKPLENALTGAIGGGGGLFGGLLGSLFGGGGAGAGAGSVAFGSVGGTPMGVFGLAEGGPASAGVPVMVGERGPELFMPDVAGTVVPNLMLDRGGAVIVQQTINVHPEVSAVARMEIARQLPMIGNYAKNAVLSARRRGGSYAAALR